MIAAHSVLRLSDGYHVDTLAGLETHVPVILRHARDDMVVGELPMLSDAAVLNPDVRILFRKGRPHLGILHEDAGVRLTVVVHDLTLVVHQILDGQRRGDHLARGAEVVELTTCQWHDGHTELPQLLVDDQRVCAQCASELGIQVVLL